MKKLLTLALLLTLSLGIHAQLLWKISGNGLSQPSYLFGTHHLAPITFLDSISGMTRVQADIRQVYGECVMSEMQDPALLTSMQQQMVLPQDTTLQSLFSPGQYEKLAAVVKQYTGADLAQLSQLKPTTLTQQLTLILCMMHMPGFNPQQQLDTYFQQQALQQGKTVGGLETAASQIPILYSSQSLIRQAELLMCMVEDMDKAWDETQKLNNAYLKQDLETILSLTEQNDGTTCSPTPQELDILIYNRNAAWAQKMPAVMQQAPTLFAVGAAHLPGTKGVIHLLRQQGYTVEPVR